MPNIMVQSWARTFAQGSGGCTHHQEEDSSTSLINWLKVVRLWIVRSQQRRTLIELVEQDDRMLRDIGVSRDAAHREAAKPFWRR